ncbi:MAG: hypothetical protein U0Y68_20710 [Blastocatellia bacterium]
MKSVLSNSFSTALIILLTIPFLACQKPSRELPRTGAGPLLFACGVMPRKFSPQRNLSATDTSPPVRKATDLAEGVVEQIGSDIEAGKFDKAQWDVLLTNAITETQKLLPLVTKSGSPRAQEILTLALTILPEIKALVDAIKPPPMPATPTLRADAQQREQAASLTNGQIAALVTIATTLGIQIISIETTSDLPTLWAKFHAGVAAYGPPSQVAPAKAGKKVKK